MFSQFLMSKHNVFSLQRYFLCSFYRISFGAYFSKRANAHDRRKLFSTVDLRYFRTFVFGTNGECSL